ncbi:hypothetical protein LGK95_20070 [Clostridium algoriphilum]|uniref:hypothetical protein n=1 Tax=Clostridium algoriphilum TaxID=198347 RepID=UPI001CF43471|nr:hypothetical protein [Clostridium algoriphilum]MCB2295775.1 hypothetical protein [Clostridium algoriphilum]
MKQIKIFKNNYEGSLVREVNEFITNNKVTINDIQYSSTGGSFFHPTQYSVLIIIEDEEI